VLVTQFSAIVRWWFKIVPPQCRSYQASVFCSTGDIHIHILEQGHGLSDNLIHIGNTREQRWFDSRRLLRHAWDARLKQTEVRFERRACDVSLTTGG
jgi:hypothetical protein